MWIDLSIQLNSEFPVWPGTSPCHISSDVSKNCVSSTLTTNVHAATHIDAPYHFIPDGLTIDQISLNQLCGVTQVIEIPDSTSIKPDHLTSLNCSKVIFKTPNEVSDSFTNKYCYLTPQSADILVDSGVHLVGVDYLSVENYDDTNFTTHKILLGNSVVIIESLDTSKLDLGYYYVIALPILMHTEASLARVIARKISLTH